MYSLALISKNLMMLSDVLLLAASVYGIRTFLIKNSPLYFKILTLATLCYANVSIFRMLYYLCFSENFQGLGITFLGYFGCYLFLFSANFGQYDSFIDDRTDFFKKYRNVSFVAPIIILILLIAYLITNADEAITLANIVTFVGYVPAIIASYYNLKHSLIPDMDFEFIKWVRRANICALFIEVFDVLRILTSNLFENVIGAMLSVAIAVAFLMMLIFAQRSRKTWLQ